MTEASTPPTPLSGWGTETKNKNRRQNLCGFLSLCFFLTVE